MVQLTNIVKRVNALSINGTEHHKSVDPKPPIVMIKLIIRMVSICPGILFAYKTSMIPSIRPATTIFSKKEMIRIVKTLWSCVLFKKATI